MLIESSKDVETDLKPLCVELQYNLGLWQKPQSPTNCHGLQFYNPEEKSHQKLFNKPQNYCLTMAYINLLSTKAGLQQCLIMQVRTGGMGEQQNETFGGKNERI